MVKKTKNKLSSYRKKRDFTTSPEPAGKIKKKRSHSPIFVIHEHHATHLHYDLRLEIGGVLASWAVPKGPPLRYGQKRLAVTTEDHPIEYATFYGVIPEGSYGAGKVTIWDKGTFENIKKHDDKPVSLDDSLKQGSIEIRFKGKKLKGSYALVRTSLGDGKKNWLLFKIKEKDKSNA